MRTFLYLFILTFCADSSFGQCDKANIDKREMFQFIISLHPKDSLQTIYLSNSNHFKQIEEDLKTVFKDSIFTKQDIDYFNIQIKSYRYFKWTSKNVERAKIVSNRKLNRLYKNYNNWDKFHKECGEYILGYSVPIYTCDKTKLLIYRTTYCGALCGSGAISVYEKRNGQWTYLKDYGLTVS